MKKLATVAMLCACTLAFSACGESGDLLCAPERAEPLSYTERQEAAEECVDLCAAEADFSAVFSSSLYGERSGKGNFVAAPLSVYSALALAAECVAGDTREEILSALGVSYEVLNSASNPGKRGEIKPVLQSLGVRALFDGAECDFTPFTDDECYCAGVTHAAKLKADKKGIEGAAATVIGGAMSAGPGEETEIYEDFLVDGAFGFVLTDPGDVILFCGVVERL